MTFRASGVLDAPPLCHWDDNRLNLDGSGVGYSSFHPDIQICISVLLIVVDLPPLATR
eukprot:m.75394 g.75394  ORF g.75394 m.75394 type:complete len:58 (+) comp8480_c1_seq2:1618-1791(+)